MIPHTTIYFSGLVTHLSSYYKTSSRAGNMENLSCISRTWHSVRTAEMVNIRNEDVVASCPSPWPRFFRISLPSPQICLFSFRRGDPNLAQRICKLTSEGCRGWQLSCFPRELQPLSWGRGRTRERLAECFKLTFLSPALFFSRQYLAAFHWQLGQRARVYLLEPLSCPLGTDDTNDWSSYKEWNPSLSPPQHWTALPWAIS